LSFAATHKPTHEAKSKELCLPMQEFCYPEKSIIYPPHTALCLLRQHTSDTKVKFKELFHPPQICTGNCETQTQPKKMADAIFGFAHPPPNSEQENRIDQKTEY